MRLVLLITLLLFSLQAKSLFSNNDQIDNSKYINSLKDLVIATQKTRGLTNSYLNGNLSALLLIHGNKRDMKTAIGIMESLPLASNPTINERATSISQALIKLNNKALKLEAGLVFDSYTEQIEQILMLAQTVSKQGSKDLNELGQEASTVMMEIILPLSEQIGRTRGMGSGVIAKGQISDEQKYSVTAMLNEINDLESKLQTQMQLIVAKNRDMYDVSIDKNLLSTKEHIASYVQLTQKNVLNNAKEIDSNDYFNKGTDIISTLINLFDSNNKAIVADSKGWI